MKRQELIDRLSAELANFTVLDGEEEWPFGWNLTRDHKKGEYGTTAQKQKELRSRKAKYNAASDGRLSDLLKPISASYDAGGIRYFMHIMATVITAGLCKYWIQLPTQEDISKLLSLAGVSAKEMNAFCHSLDNSELSCLSSEGNRSISILLYKVLFDAMCEGCGVTGWSWEEYEEKSRSRFADEAKTPESAPKKSKKEQYVRKGENAALMRLNAVSEYLQEVGLLQLDSMDAGEQNPKMTKQQLLEKAQEAYADFFCRYALLWCREAIALQESIELGNRAQREKKRVIDQIEKLVEKARWKNLRAAKEGNAAKAPGIPAAARAGGNFMMPGQVPGMPQMGRDDYMLSYGILNTAKQLFAQGNEKEAADLLAKRFVSSGNFPFADIENRSVENQNALTGYVCAAALRAVHEFKEQAAQKAELMRRWDGDDEDYQILAERCFLAVTAGDEVYRLNVACNVYILLGYSMGIPFMNGIQPELEDKDEWDEIFYPGDNGSLAQAVVKEGDVIFVSNKGEKAEESDVQMLSPVKIGSAIAEYAGYRFDDGLYIRKSIVKAFRKMGCSERKARDYAIIVATVQKMHDNESGMGMDLYNEAIAADGYPDENAALAAALRDKEQAERSGRAAERESKALRHELAQLQRKLAQQQQKMTEEIGKRDELLALYENAAQSEEETDEGDDSLFPFRTKLNVVLYGGFHSFHQEIEKRIPNIRIIPSTSHIDLSPVRNADIVFLQINKTCHSNYWNVCDAARNMNIPFYHLNYAGPKRCASEMVEQIRKIEAKKN